MTEVNYNCYPGGLLSPTDSKYLDKMSVVLIKDFNALNRNFIEDNDLSALSLILPAASRDSTGDSIFEMICRLQILITKIELNKIPDTIVTEKHYSRIIKEILSKNNLNDIRIKIRKSERILYRISKNSIINIYNTVAEILFSKFFLKRQKISEITYLDMFMPNSCISKNGEIQDRYYSGYRKYLSYDCLKNIWVAPIFSQTFSLITYYYRYKAISQSKINFLCHENWLSVLEHLRAIYQSFYLPILTLKKQIYFRGIDVSDIYKLSLYKNIFSPGLTLSLKKYLLIKKLKQSGVSISLVIDWFENQIVDRAISIAVHEFYPQTPIHGYQGFPLNYSNPTLRPSEFERINFLMPDIVYLISKSTYSLLKMENKKIDYRLTYAFRYKHLLTTENNNTNSIITIAIVLTGYIKEVETLLSLASHLHTNIDRRMKLIIKSNPIINTDKHIGRYFSNKQDIFVTEEPISDLLSYVSVVITSGSSVSVESVTLGIPTIIFGNQRGITNIFLPPDFRNELWTISYDYKSVIDFIERIKIDNIKKDLSELEIENEAKIEELFCHSG